MFLAMAFALSAAVIVPQDTATSSFTVDGIKVILRRNETNNIIAANLYLLGGTRQAPAGKDGIEPFLLEVAERGTAKYPKNILRRKMSLLGGEIEIDPSSDWTMYGMRVTTAIFDSTWAIFADQLMAPAIQSAEVELVRQQMLSGIRQQRDDPDALVHFLADSITFIGHPYGVPIAGSELSISSITAADLRAYQKSAMVKSRMLLVVVGDISRAKLEAAVRRTLAKLPQGNYTWTLPAEVLPPVPSNRPAVVIETRDLPTNYLLGYYAGPLASSKDYQALRLATSVLTGRMFNVIRSSQNLTYDVHAPFVDRAATVGGLYVSTVAPDKVLELMRALVDEIQVNTLSRIGLNLLVQQFITDYFMDNETNAAQANFLARAELYQGDYRFATGEQFIASLRSITPQDIQRVARTYMRNMRFAYVGNPQLLSPSLLERF